MSNTTMEYSRFTQLADADPAESAQVIVLDGAQGGQTAPRWADPKSPLWQKADERRLQIITVSLRLQAIAFDAPSGQGALQNAIRRQL